MAAEAAARIGGLLEADVAHAADVVSLNTARGRRSARELLRLLEEADRDLSARLRDEAARQPGGATGRFTGASAESYRQQIRVVREYVQNRLGGMTAEQAQAALADSVTRSTALLSNLDRAFTGVTRPLRIRQAAVMDRITNGTRASLLAQHATSVDRYGDAMIQQHERMIRAGLISGASQEEMVAALTGHGGPTGRVSLAARVNADGTVIRLIEQEIPEGLFVRYRYWAERIVRTEVAHAYQEAHLQTLFEARREDFPDLQKKIMATFDSRTAPDSVAVHGQIRDLEDMFQDGAGRQYLRPPGRPNDRETVIPWRAGWPETEASRPMPATAVTAALEAGPVYEAARRARLAGIRTESRRERAEGRAILRRQVAAEQAEQRTQQAQDRASERVVERAPPADPMVEARATRARALTTQGYSAEAIERDLAEIGTELSSDAIREQAKAMAAASKRLRRSPTTEGGVRRQITPEIAETLRTGTRRLIRTVDPEFTSRDVVEDYAPGIEGRPQRNALSMTRIIDEEDGPIASHNRLNGAMRINRAASRGVATALRDLARGRDPGEEGWNHLGVVIHEEQHGGSRITGYYRGLASSIEEATVESRTRHIVGELARVTGSPHRPLRLPEVRIQDGRPRIVSESNAWERARYQDWVGGLHVAVSEVTGLEGAQLSAHVQQRLGTWFGPSGAGTLARTEEEYIEAFVEIMHPDDPARMQRALREHLEEW